jgi:hypothetical protein
MERFIHFDERDWALIDRERAGPEHAGATMRAAKRPVRSPCWGALDVCGHYGRQRPPVLGQKPAVGRLHPLWASTSSAATAHTTGGRLPHPRESGSQGWPAQASCDSIHRSSAGPFRSW